MSWSLIESTAQSSGLVSSRVLMQINAEGLERDLEREGDSYTLVTLR